MHYIKQLAEWRKKEIVKGSKKKRFAYGSQAKQHEPRKKNLGCVICSGFRHVYGFYHTQNTKQFVEGYKLLEQYNPLN